MEEVSLVDQDLKSACMDALVKFPVVMVQFPEVFALLALPNQDGVNGLNQIKKRLPNKFYGTVVGDSSRFLGMAVSLPKFLPVNRADQMLSGCIARIEIASVNQNTISCPKGTHQSLFLSDTHFRSLFSSLETSFAGIADADLFLGHSYSAPLCTSANISGHPDGSITDLEIARNFGMENGVPLLIRSDDFAEAKGSYPVLFLEEHNITVHRIGPGIDELVARFPKEIIRYSEHL